MMCPCARCEAEDFDQAIARIHLVEDDLAANSWNDDAVAVPRSRDDALEDPAGSGAYERAKRQRGQQAIGRAPS